MSTSILKIENLTLVRNGTLVLKDVSLTVQSGEVLVMIGQSGSGKSSLLRCINRLEQPYSGEILFKGTDIATLPVLELRRKIGMVFQKTVAFAGTVAENIAYGHSLQNKTLSKDAILSLMEQVALEQELLDKDASQLSGGQEQRMAMARALANQPQILLLDEPTSALDPIATHKVEDALLNIRKNSDLTLVWVSHSVEQARRVADRVVLLDEGEVVRIGTVTEMLDEHEGDSRALAFAHGVDDDE